MAELDKAAVEALNETLRNLGGAATRAADGLAGLAGTVTNGRQGLENYNNAVKNAARASSALVPGAERLGDAFAKSNDQVSRLKRSYDTLQQSGAALGDNLTGLADAGSKFGLAIGSSEEQAAKLAKVLGTNSGVLARMSGTVVDGRNKFAEAFQAMEPFKLGLQNIGIGYEEQMEHMADFMRIQESSGRLQKMSADELAMASAKYMRNLSDLAAITGTSIQEQKQAQEQARAEQRFGAMVFMEEQRAQQLEASGRKEEADRVRKGLQAMETFNGALSKSAPNLAKGLRDMAAGAVNTPEARQAVQMTGGMGKKIMEDLKSGAISEGEAMKRLQQAVNETTKRMAPLAAVSDSFKDSHGNFNEAAKISAMSMQDQAKALEKTTADREKAERDSTGQIVKANAAENKNRVAQIEGQRAVGMATDATLDLNNKMGDFALQTIPDMVVKFGDVGTAVGRAAREANSLADALKILDEEFTKATGTGLSKAQAGKAAGAAGGATGGGMGLTPGQMRSAAGAAMPGAGGGPPGGAAGAAMPGVGGGPPGGAQINIDNLLDFGGNTGSKQHFGRLEPGVQQRMLPMAKEFKEGTGKKLQINSAYRSPEEQANVKSGTNPKAAPGRSLHNVGRAVDLNSDQVQWLQQNGLLSKYGASTIPGDPPHIQFRDGGVASGPMAGYMAMLHGMEAVVPLGNNRRIPVQIKMPQNTIPGLGEGGMPSAQARTMEQTFGTMMQQMRTQQESTMSGLEPLNKTMNQILDVLRQQNSTTGKLLQAARN